jgi:hypothetical protein
MSLGRILTRALALACIFGLDRVAEARVFFGPPGVLNILSGSKPGANSWIATDGAGTWVTMWRRGVSPNEFFFRRSTDGGQTWSFPYATLDPMAASDMLSDERAMVTAGSGGTWIAVLESRNTTGILDRDVRVARSTDGGATWSTQYVDPNAGSDSLHDTEPFVATDGAGTWIVLWTVKDGGAMDFELFISRSTDDGATWSMPTLFSAQRPSTPNTAHTPQLAYAGAGVWVATWGSSFGGPFGSDDEVAVARSVDGGMTWSAPAPLNSDASVDTGYDVQPQIASDAAGKLVVAWVSNKTFGGTLTPQNHALAARSIDSGATWSSPAAVDARAVSEGEISGIQLRVATDRAGTWTAAWETQAAPAGPGKAAAVMARSTDDGASWTIPTTMDHVITDHSYWSDFDPHVAGDPSGRFIGVWTRRDDTDFEEDEDEIQFAIAEPLCPPAPLGGCRTAASGQLTVRDWSADRKDRLAWTWLAGAETMLEDFGDPFTTTDYRVCLYDAVDRVLLGAEAPAGGTCGTVNCWRYQGSNAIAYRDLARDPYGMDKMKLQAGAAGKAKIKLTARGVNVSTPVLRFLALPLRFQLQASNGECWEATYSAAVVNTPAQLKAKPD